MTSRILAVFDGTPLGHLAVETAFQAACSKTEAELYVLAVPVTPGDTEQNETLHDDLLAFAQVGRRLGVLVDGTVTDVADAERIVNEIRQRKIDRVVIARPAPPDPDTAMNQLLDMAAKTTDIATIEVRDGNQSSEVRQ